MFKGWMLSFPRPFAVPVGVRLDSPVLIDDLPSVGELSQSDVVEAAASLRIC